MSAYKCQFYFTVARELPRAEIPQIITLIELAKEHRKKCSQLAIWGEAGHSEKAAAAEERLDMIEQSVQELASDMGAAGCVFRRFGTSQSVLIQFQSGASNAPEYGDGESGWVVP